MKRDKPVAPADLWAQLDKSLVQEVMPADAITPKQFAEHYGISPDLARHRLARLVAGGVMERGGTTRIWYRLKEQK